MKYIGIDLWDKRVGLAKADDENFAFALWIFPRIQIVSELKKIEKKFVDLEQIIVGLPYDLYGKDTKQLEKTQKFIEKLWEIFPNKKIIGHDERFSSFVADEGFSQHRDDIAAQIILQSYLDSLP